jgi:hypothetical protein
VEDAHSLPAATTSPTSPRVTCSECVVEGPAIGALHLHNVACARAVSVVAEFVDTTQRTECRGELPTASARGFEGRDDETLKPRAGRRVSIPELDLTRTLRGVVIED